MFPQDLHPRLLFPLQQVNKHIRSANCWIFSPLPRQIRLKFPLTEGKHRRFPSDNEDSLRLEQRENRRTQSESQKNNRAETGSRLEIDGSTALFNLVAKKIQWYLQGSFARFLFVITMAPVSV